jgi:hypothetical protein
MPLPGITITRTDGNLGLTRAVPDKMLVIGPCSAGTPAALHTFAQPSRVVAELGVGQAVTAACHILDIAGGSVDVLVTDASVAGENSSVTGSGTGPDVTLSGDALELFDGKILVTAGGALGVGRFQYSLDGGQSYGSVRTIPANGAFVIPSSGLTATFTAVSALVRSGGMSGPVVTLTGTPTALTDYDIIIEITTGGTVGVAAFRWSDDGGTTYTTGVATASTVVLTDTGLTANFPAGTYVDDEIYAWTTGYNAGETYTFTASPDTFDSTDLDEAAETLFTLNDRWKAVVFAGRQVDSTAAAVIAETAGGHMADLADEARDARALIDCGTEDDVDDIHEDFETVEDLRLACFYGSNRVAVANPIEGWRRPMIPNVVSAAAMVAAFTRGTNIGWVGDGSPPNGGRMPKVSGISFDEYIEGEQLHDRQVNATRTYVGRSGFYFVNGLLKSPAGSDFRYLHWGLAFDIACQTVFDAMQRYVNASVPRKTDGSNTITAEAAAAVNKRVNQALKRALLDPSTEQGPGLVDAASFAVDETYDIFTNKKLRGSFRVLPKANTEGVELTGGLATDLTAGTTTEAA